MVITNDGNVGIGTTTPVQKLDVNGPARVFGNSNFTIGLPTSYDFLLETGMTNRRFYFGGNGNGYSLQSLESTTTNTLPMSLNPIGGNIGIGTISPIWPLQVNMTNPAATSSGITINAYESGKWHHG